MIDRFNNLKTIPLSLNWAFSNLDFKWVPLIGSNYMCQLGFTMNTLVAFQAIWRLNKFLTDAYSESHLKDSAISREKS